MTDALKAELKNLGLEPFLIVRHHSKYPDQEKTYAEEWQSERRKVLPSIALRIKNEKDGLQKNLEQKQRRIADAL